MCHQDLYYVLDWPIILLILVTGILWILNINMKIIRSSSRAETMNNKTPSWSQIQIIPEKSRWNKISKTWGSFQTSFWPSQSNLWSKGWKTPTPQLVFQNKSRNHLPRKFQIRRSWIGTSSMVINMMAIWNRRFWLLLEKMNKNLIRQHYHRKSITVKSNTENIL